MIGKPCPYCERPVAAPDFVEIITLGRFDFAYAIFHCPRCARNFYASEDGEAFSDSDDRAKLREQLVKRADSKCLIGVLSV